MNILKYILILIILIPSVSAYNLSGYVYNNLDYPLENTRIDIDSNHTSTSVSGYYNFTNISEGNYTILARHSPLKPTDGHFVNYTENISIIGDTNLDIIMREKTYPVQVTPGFEFVGLIFILLVLSKKV